MTQSISPMVALMVTIYAMVESTHANPLWVADKRAEPEESKPAESKAEPKASETHKDEAKPTASSHEKPSVTSKTEPKETEKPKASSTHKEAHASSTTTKKAASTSSEKEKKADATSSSNPFSFNGVSPIGASQHGAAASPTATDSFVDQGNSDNKESSGVSGGAVAGIVIAVLVGVAAVFGFILVRKKRKSAELNRSRMNPDPFTMGFGSNDPPPFNNSNNYPPHTAYTANQSPMIQLPPIGASAPSPVMAPTMTHSPAINQYNSEVNHYNNTAAASNAMQSMPSPEYNHAPSPVPAPVVVSAPQESPQPVQAQANKSLGVLTVVSTYTPTLSDELDIQPGDRVDVLEEYDDGWCQGINLSRGNCKGVFPRHCVDFFGDNSQQQQMPQADSNKLYDASSMKRVSSMLGPQQQQSPYYL